MIRPREAKPFTRNRTTATCIPGIRSKTTSTIRIHFHRLRRPREARPFARLGAREAKPFTRFTRRFFALGVGIFVKRLR
jgi:hypothetical protein